MDWKDTVMNDTVKRQFHYIPDKPSPDVSRGDVEGMLLTQAEISYKMGYNQALGERDNEWNKWKDKAMVLAICNAMLKGRREVVEYLNSKRGAMFAMIYYGEESGELTFSVDTKEWQAKLKDWGILREASDE